MTSPPTASLVSAVEGKGEMDPLAMIACPFCGEDDFDAYGLKTHLNMGWCEPFEAIGEADRLPASHTPVSSDTPTAVSSPAAEGERA